MPDIFSDSRAVSYLRYNSRKHTKLDSHLEFHPSVPKECVICYELFVHEYKDSSVWGKVPQKFVTP